MVPTHRLAHSSAGHAFDNYDASRQVDRNIVIPENVRVRVYDNRDRVVNQTDVLLREH